MSERNPGGTEDAAMAAGPRVGLASYEFGDPEATFRPIEPFRPRPAPRRPGLVGWALRTGLVWSVNLGALAAAGLLVTNVGTNDPSTYVMGAVLFGLAGVSLGLATRFVPGRWRIAAPVLGLLAADALLVWLMTVVAPPFHPPDPAAIAKAAVVMWLANLPLWLLLPLRRAPAAAPPAG